MALKATKAVRRQVTAHVPRGINPEIIVTVYPHGVIGLREARRRRGSEQQIEVGGLYTMLVAKAARERRTARRGTR